MSAAAPVRADLEAGAVPLERLLPRDTARLLGKLGRLAEERGEAAYLVGGLVRDLYLGVEAVDLDVAVEGNGPDFARTAGRRLGASVSVHGPFLTATATFGDGTQLDVATARAERYERPGALPAVRPASMDEDLRRRDVTINAMAVALNPGAFGRVLDPHGGRRDLARRRLAVLHALSFRDDPTRMLRLGRLAARYGFRLERVTRRLLAEALRARAFDAVSADRLRNELLMGFVESSPGRVFQVHERLGTLAALLPGALAGPGLPRLFDMTERLTGYVERTPDWDPTVVPLLVLLRRATAVQVRSSAGRLNLPPRTLRALLAVPAFGRLAAGVRAARRPSAVHEVISSLPLEAQLAMTIMERSPATRRRMLDSLRRAPRAKPRLTGHDLAALGVARGPLMKRVLDALRRARMDGRVATRRQEEAFVRRNFPHHGTCGESC